MQNSIFNQISFNVTEISDRSLTYFATEKNQKYNPNRTTSLQSVGYLSAAFFWKTLMKIGNSTQYYANNKGSIRIRPKRSRIVVKPYNSLRKKANFRRIFKRFFFNNFIKMPLKIKTHLYLI